MKGPKSIDRVRDASETPSPVVPGQDIPTPGKEVQLSDGEGGKRRGW
jgi:hypothetical protein